MTRSEIAALTLSGAALVGVVLCAGKLNDVAARLDTLGTPAADSKEPPRDTSAVSQELQRLRAQVASLEGRLQSVTTAQNPGGAAPSTVPATGGTPAGEPTKRVQATPEEENKRQEEWLAKRASTVSDWLTEKIALTAAQKLEVEEAIKEAHRALKVAFTARPSGEDGRKITEEVYGAMDERISRVLTAEQARAYAEIASAPGGLMAQAAQRVPASLGVTVAPADGTPAPTGK